MKDEFDMLEYFSKKNSHPKSKSEIQNEKNLMKMIKKHDLDVKQYPQIYYQSQINMCIWLLKSNEWYECEERLLNNKELLRFYCEKIMKFNSLAAFSIVQRNNLKMKHKELEKYKLSQVIPNPIFKYDSFNPTEENLEWDPKKTYVNLKDFGISENDVIFIQGLEEKKFTEAKSDLENASLVLK